MITTFGAVGSIAYSASATADPFTVRANGGLNVRTGPGTNYRILGTLPTGSNIDSTGPSRNGWMPISYRGQEGWVSGAYLNAVGAGNTPSQAVPAERGTAYTTARLNVRTGASLSYRVVTVLDKGAKVSTTGVAANGYSQIVHGEQLRWVATRYLSQTVPSQPQPVGDGLPTPTGSATATAPLLIRTTSGSDFTSVATVPVGTVLQLTGVTENGRTQVIYQGSLRWVTSQYLSGTASVPKPPTSALPSTTGTKYATTALILRSSPEDQFVNHGDAPRGAALQVTGRVVNGRAEVVYQGNVRWVTAQYLADSAPAAPTFNLPGLTPNSRYLLAEATKNFPEIRTIYGVRSDPIPDHPSGRALDFMTYTNKDVGNRLAAWAQANATELNIDYIIWDQRIWSVARQREGWRFMADRGSNTANHKDHVHITVKR